MRALLLPCRLLPDMISRSKCPLSNDSEPALMSGETGAPPRSTRRVNASKVEMPRDLHQSHTRLLTPLGQKLYQNEFKLGRKGSGKWAVPDES